VSGPWGRAGFAEAPDVLTVVECARLARTGPKPIYRAVASGELFGRRIGKQIRVPKRAFIAWLEGAENGGNAPPELRIVETDGPHASAISQNRLRS
jgi:excisionase family DNA binding protein